MARRFFSPTAINPPRVTIQDGEAHHLLHVLRLGVGDTIELFDGSGNEYQARIETISRNWASLFLKETVAGGWLKRLSSWVCTHWCL